VTDAVSSSALTDRAQITDLIYRYCRAVDRLDIPLGHSIWHEDSWADYGPEVYQGPGKGVIDQICAQHLHTLHHSHQVSNILIELSGDTAGSESYVTATLRIKRGEQLLQIGVWGRYIDRWSRRGGQWGLDRRVSIRDFDEIRPVTQMQRHQIGKRDRSDPSYAVLGGGQQ
jgi:hypothetical protein